MRKPEHYVSKTIRVRSVLVGYHELALYSADCGSQIKYVRADFDPETRKQLVQGVSNLGESGIQRGNFWVTVTAVGRFESISESDCKKDSRESGVPNIYYPNYCYRIAIKDVERIDPAAPPVARLQ
jgi:hypothetical protein